MLYAKSDWGVFGNAPVDAQRLPLKATALLIDRSLLPALGGLIVSRTGVDPAPAGRGHLTLPERCTGFQSVDDELTGGKGFTTVYTDDRHQDDLVGRQQPTDAVNHQRVEDRPASTRFADNCLQHALGHSRVVLKGHFGHSGAFVHLAHEADKGGQSADLRIVPAQCGQFGANYEIRLLNTNDHLSHRTTSGRKQVTKKPRPW